MDCNTWYLGNWIWVLKPITPAVSDGNWINFQFLSPSVGYFTSQTGTYATTDTGTTWKKIHGQMSIGLNFSDAQTGLIFTNPDSLYRTMDGGLNWVPFSLIPNAQPVKNDIFVVFQFTDAQHGWMMDATSLNASTDGGRNWTTLSRSTTTDSTFFINFRMLNNQTGYLLTPQQIMKTTNGGISWTQEYKSSSTVIVGFYCLDATHAWAACEKGVILKYHQ